MYQTYFGYVFKLLYYIKLGTFLCYQKNARELAYLFWRVFLSRKGDMETKKTIF